MFPQLLQKLELAIPLHECPDIKPLNEQIRHIYLPLIPLTRDPYGIVLDYLLEDKFTKQEQEYHTKQGYDIQLPDGTMVGLVIYVNYLPTIWINHKYYITLHRSYIQLRKVPNLLLAEEHLCLMVDKYAMRFTESEVVINNIVRLNMKRKI